MDASFEVAAQAAQRWQQRQAERDMKRDSLNRDGIAAVESSDRIRQRLERLSGHAAAPMAVIDPLTSGALIETFTMERVLGKNDLSSIGVLELALAVGRFVGRVCICSASGWVQGYGTGFMVSPNLLLTNHHVLPGVSSASPSRVEFDYQLDRYGRQLPIHAFRLDPARFFMTDVKLDFTLVAVQPKADDQVELKFFAWTPLIGSLGKALIGDPLNIIQHPQGEPKQIAFRNNHLIDLFDQYAHYETDTEPGSSGSPVFNDQWEVIALHHSGVPKMQDGQYIAVDGSIWKPGMDPDRLAWVANEGIRVSSLVEHVKQAHLTGEQARLRNELIQITPPSPIEIAAQYQDSTKRTATQPAAAPSIHTGELVFQIPLQVSIRLGVPTLPGAVAVQAQVPAAVSSTAQPAVLPIDAGAPPDSELRAALAELEEAENRPYYDEAADLAARAAYYQDIPGGLDPSALFHNLSGLLERTHTTRLSYKPARHVYPWVDLHKDDCGLAIHSIYSGGSFDPREFIEADFRMEQERARLAEVQRSESVFALMSEAAQLDLLEAALPYNCEHVVPQSWFDKREPMRGDLHHLFALESGCNSFRGNTPYYDFPDFEEVIREGCGKREQGKFEPNNGKGAIARAVMYFLLRYPGQINRNSKEYTVERLKVLKRWHAGDPPGLYELHRNQAIYETQGNRNPLIDHPEWVEQIDFRLGLGLA